MLWRTRVYFQFILKTGLCVAATEQAMQKHCLKSLPDLVILSKSWKIIETVKQVETPIGDFALKRGGSKFGLFTSTKDPTKR